jgi:hypothetical protein
MASCSPAECCETAKSDACLIASQFPLEALRRGSVAGLKAAGAIMQIIAPKCALCWSTYVGLANSTWGAATQLHPAWLLSSIWLSTLTIAVMLLHALKAGRYGPAACATAAYLLLVAGWLLDTSAARYGGFVLLAIAFAMEGSGFRKLCKRPAAKAPSARSTLPNRHMSTQ